MPNRYTWEQFCMKMPRKIKKYTTVPKECMAKLGGCVGKIQATLPKYILRSDMRWYYEKWYRSPKRWELETMWVCTSCFLRLTNDPASKDAVFLRVLGEAPLLRHQTNEYKERYQKTHKEWVKAHPEEAKRRYDKWKELKRAWGKEHYGYKRVYKRKIRDVVQGIKRTPISDERTFSSYKEVKAHLFSYRKTKDEDEPGTGREV